MRSLVLWSLALSVPALVAVALDREIVGAVLAVLPSVLPAGHFLIEALRIKADFARDLAKIEAADR